MDWNQVVADPALADLPYKIELNEWGNIEMSPASNLHGLLQTNIAFLLREKLPGGKAFVECSILTSKNVKVADVVWGSDDFFRKNGMATPLLAAPEICVEILSPGNSVEEMAMKRELYLAKGAREVWMCRESGDLSFFDPSGEIQSSAVCPDFPKVVDV